MNTARTSEHASANMIERTDPRIRLLVKLIRDQGKIVTADVVYQALTTAEGDPKNNLNRLFRIMGQEESLTQPGTMIKVSDPTANDAMLAIKIINQMNFRQRS